MANLSSTVASNDSVTHTQYNNLRSDAIGPFNAERVWNDNEIAAFGTLGADGQIYSDGTDFYIDALGGGNINLQVSGTTVLQVTSSGVTTTSDITKGSGGITEDTNWNDISVNETSGDRGFSILTANTARGGVVFGDPEDPDAGRLIYDHSDDSFDLVTNATLAVSVNSSQEATLYGATTWSFGGAGNALRAGGDASGSGFIEIRADDNGTQDTTASTDAYLIRGTRTAGKNVLAIYDEAGTRLIGLDNEDTGRLYVDGMDLDVGGYVILNITDTDGTVEGSLWYDASEDELKFRTASGVKTITSS